MSFFGVIRPGVWKQDQRFTDRAAFGRLWLTVRDNPDAQNYIVLDHTIYGWPFAKDAVRNRITSSCRECGREYVDAAHPDGTGMFCYGCDCAEMSFHQPESYPIGTWCPVGTAHSFPRGVDKCLHCQQTRQQLEAHLQAALVWVRS